MPKARTAAWCSLYRFLLNFRDFAELRLQFDAVCCRGEVELQAGAGHLPARVQPTKSLGESPIPTRVQAPRAIPGFVIVPSEVGRLR